MANHQGFNRCTPANFDVYDVMGFKNPGGFKFSDFTGELRFSML